ncbi:hypothetical protein KKH27_14170 [bacterium]|nr:hypothetical protein [bacterium]MBU1984629.1 hypothetical protein [bacterium]
MRRHPIGVQMRRIFCMIGFGFAVLLTGCKSSPTDSPAEQQATLAGTYVGIGNLGGSQTNILMEFSGPDSLDAYGGTIRYRSAVLSFDDVYVNAEGDTVFFRYSRDSVVYRAWGLIEHTSLDLSFIEPTGVASFQVNRKSSGFNLSGLWSGIMSSTYVSQPVSAVMNMNQQGQLFWGTIDLSPSYTLNIQISSGASAEASFQFSGEAWVFSERIPASFAGSYFAPDTISGLWQAGESPLYDSGEFLFWRSFY